MIELCYDVYMTDLFGCLLDRTVLGCLLDGALIAHQQRGLEGRLPLVHPGLDALQEQRIGADGVPVVCHHPHQLPLAPAADTAHTTGSRHSTQNRQHRGDETKDSLCGPGMKSQVWMAFPFFLSLAITPNSSPWQLWYRERHAQSAHGAPLNTVERCVVTV